MKLHITKKRSEQGQWADPMMKYLEDYLNEIQQDYYDVIIRDMASLYQFLIHLDEEFRTANPRYRRPLGFSITYSRPACCIESITINYINEYIIVKPVTKTEETLIHS